MTSEHNLGYTMAAFRSILLAQDAVRDGEYFDHWYAPGWEGTSWWKMPNRGGCECGQGFEVTEVYHFYASCDGKWHTRYGCYQVGDPDG
jgi:hypothetical protein